MASLATAFVSIRPDTAGFSSRLSKDVSTSAARAGDAGGKKLSGGMSRHFKGIAASLAGVFAVTKGVEFFKGMIDEATEAQKVSRQTAAVIKSTGGVANVSAKDIDRLTASLSAKAGIDDEIIAGGANMLLTFKNIRNEAGKGNDIFNQTTKATLDMSVAMGKDLRSSSVMVGKALNDPIKGITALTRVGVTFTEGQKEQIKRMTESGNVMGAQRMILKELNSEFAGSAEAQATPAEKAAVAWGNFKELLGTSVMPIVGRVADLITTKIVPALTRFVEGMKNGTGVGGVFASVFKTVGGALAFLGGVIMNNKAVVATFVTVLGGFMILRSITTAVLAFNIALRANPIGMVVTALAAMAAGLVYAYQHSATFRNVVDKAWKVIKGAVSSAWNGTIRPALVAFAGFIKNTVMPTVQRLWTNYVKPTMQAIGTAIKWAWNNVIKPAFAAWAAYLRNVVFPVIRFLWNNVVQPAFRGIGAIIRTAWNGVIKPVFTALKDGVESVRKAFRTGIDAIGRIWDELKEKAKTPVKYVIDTVYNKGILKVVNAIPGVGNLSPVKGFSGGGHTGPGPKMKPAGIVHADEHVWTKDEMRRFPGGHKAMERLREGVLHGRLDGKLPGYFLGGGVKPADGAVSRHGGYSWAKWAGDINEPGSADIGKPVVAWKGGTVASTTRMAGSYGNHIRINHPGGERTLYAHLQGFGVGAGAKVNAGQRIGSKGNTGNSTGPHLHFELAGGKNPIDASETGGDSGGSFISKVFSKLNPLSYFKLDSWKSKLAGMGAWGKMGGDMVGSLAGKFKGWAGDKIKAAYPDAAMKDILSGKPQLTWVKKIWKSITGGGGPGTSNDSGAGGLMPIMEAARKYAQERWGPMTIHGYSNRNIGGTNTKSDHAYGKALDLMGAKQDVANYFATGAGHGRFRIENTIYNRRIHNAQGWHAYTGSSPHTDHVHIDTYDTGGVLRSGALAANRSGKPERVLSPGQTKAFDGLVALLSKGGMSAPERDLLTRVTRGLWPALTKLLTKVTGVVAKGDKGGGATVRSGSFNAHTYGHKPARTIDDLRKVLPRVDSLALQEWTNAAGGAAGYLRDQGFGLFRGPTGTAIAWRKSRFTASRLGSYDLNKKYRMPKGTSQRHAVYGLLTDKETQRKFWQISSHFIPGVGYFKGRVSKAKHAAIYREQQERLTELSKRLSGSAPVIAGGDYNRRGNKIVGGLNTTTGNKIDQIYSNLKATSDSRIGGLNSDHDAVVSRYRYDRGGVARGRGAMVKDTIRPERVLSPKQTESFDRLVAVLERGGSPSSAPLIGNAVIRETVDLDRYERRRAFYERRMRVG